MPRSSLFHRRQRNVTIELVGSIRRIGPGYVFGEIAHDLPLREQKLDLSGVSKFQRTKQEARSLEQGNLTSRRGFTRASSA